MKQVIEAYVGIWILIIIMYICMAFTMINLNVTQARKTYNDIKAEISACNGSLEAYKNQHADSNITISPDGTELSYIVIKNGSGYSVSIKNTEKNREDSWENSDNQTFIYNDLYKIDMNYFYSVPIFGMQNYPIKGYAY